MDPLIPLAGAALAAGWVDAVVGGGGLIQLPALLLGFPAAAPASLLATNKVASVFGTLTSATTFLRRTRPPVTTVVAMAAPAFIGAAAGAVCASLLPANLFRPAVLVLLVLVGGYTLARPHLGRHHQVRHSGRALQLRAAAIGLGLGFYDGIFGPGTGSFLVIAQVVVLGFSFLIASATAKATNVATNLGAIMVFVVIGAPMWRVALPMGVANLIGGYLGARTAIARGSGFVRVVFLVVVAALIVRLSLEVF